MVKHAWLRFAIRRTLTLGVSLAVLLTATFLAVRLVPGDPARAGLGPTAPREQVEARRQALHLDEPLPEQYRRFVVGAFTGDLGTSFITAQPVADVIGSRFPATARLAMISFLVAMIVAIPLGMAAAILTRGGRRRRMADAFSIGTGTLISIPDYLMATALVAVFAVGLGWLPVADETGPTSYLLPVAALAALPTAAVARLARVETAKVLGEEYMRVARSKRLPARRLYLRHLLPNALTATLTVGGLLLGSLIAGTVIVENVFAWPGLGSAVTQALIEKDYPLVQGIVLLLGGIALVANTAVDVLLGLLDPRSLIRES
jgi:peptide/nickel transport system permease protein